MKSIFYTIVSVFISATSLYAQWSELGGPNSLNTNSTSFALCADPSGNIYAAGNFTNASGKYYVAKWDGNSWTELGGTNSLAANGQISNIVADANGNIYVCGNFTNASSKAYVAKFNGSSWSELGTTDASSPKAFEYLCLDQNNNVYAASIKNLSSNYFIAKFNGTSWSELGGLNSLAANSYIYSICSDASGNIYTGGAFTNPSGKKYVAKYNGMTWSELGGLNAIKADSEITALCSDQFGNIYAAGFFINSAGNYYVAKWDGSSWTELGGLNAFGANGAIWSIVSDKDGNIYAGGKFTNASGKRYIAKWNGTVWTELGGVNSLSANGDIFGLSIDNSNNIYTIGSFTNASSKYYVAMYGCPSTSSLHTVSACGSYKWLEKGNKIYTTSNSTDTIKLRNVKGCDSIVTLKLTIKKNSSSSFSKTIASGTTFEFGTKTLNKAGTYRDTLKNANAQGCDSVITLNLSLSSRIEEPLSSLMSIYPNPFDKYIHIESEVKLKSFKLIDMSGKIVKSYEGEFVQKKIPTNDISNGIYLLEYTDIYSRTYREKVNKY